MDSSLVAAIPDIGRPKVRLAQRAAEELRRLLGRPPFGPGARLPSEPELAAAMGVSRATLRAALDNLEAEGVIVRRAGVGTFVSRLPVLQNNLSVNAGVADLIRAMGLTPGSRDLALRVEPADAPTAAALALPAGAELVVIERVRTADGKPVVYSRDLFDRGLLSRAARPLGLDELAGLLREEGSLYGVFERSLSLPVAGGVARLKPVLADAELAHKLDVPAGAPLLYLEQLDHDHEQKPLLLSYEYHVPELCTFIVYRSR